MKRPALWFLAIAALSGAQCVELDDERGCTADSACADSETRSDAGDREATRREGPSSEQIAAYCARSVACAEEEDAEEESLSVDECSNFFELFVQQLVDDPTCDDFLSAQEDATVCLATAPCTLLIAGEACATEAAALSAAADRCESLAPAEGEGEGEGEGEMETAGAYACVNVDGAFAECPFGPRPNPLNGERSATATRTTSVGTRNVSVEIRAEGLCIIAHCDLVGDADGKTHAAGVIVVDEQSLPEPLPTTLRFHASPIGVVLSGLYAYAELRDASDVVLGTASQANDIGEGRTWTTDGAWTAPADGTEDPSFPVSLTGTGGVFLYAEAFCEDAATGEGELDVQIEVGEGACDS